MVPFRYNTRSLVVRKVTTIATAGGIALVVLMFAGALMLMESIKQVMVSSGRADTVVLLRKGSENELSSSISGTAFKTLGDKPQVAQVGGVGVIGEIVLVLTAERADGSGISNVTVRGMPATGIQFRPEVKIISGRAPKPGTNEAIAGVGIAGRFKGIALGEQLELRRNRPLVIVGVFSAKGSSHETEVWGDVTTIDRYVDRGGAVSSARVRLKSANAFDEYRSLVENDKSLSVKATREVDYYEKQSQGTSKFLGGIVLALAILFSLAAMIGAAITMNGAVAHRVKEIGTLRALGFSRFSILLSFVIEAVLLSLIGAVVGLALAMLATLKTFSVLNFQTFSEIVIGFQATPGIVLASIIFAVGMGLLGGIVPAIRASQVSPIEAMRA